jgi:hypothetical protein
LILAERWANFHRHPFTEDCDRHVSVYTPAGPVSR